LPVADSERPDIEPYAIVRHMGLTHAEFLRSLPMAAGGMGLRVQVPHILIEDGTRRIEIRLGPEQQRHLGSLALPVTEVSLFFHGFSPEECERFLTRFERTFQRGGG
jgi:hypothetical protein